MNKKESKYVEAKSKCMTCGKMFSHNPKAYFAECYECAQRDRVYIKPISFKNFPKQKQKEWAKKVIKLKERQIELLEERIEAIRPLK